MEIFNSMAQVHGKRQAGPIERTETSQRPITGIPLRTVCQWAILREAEKIRKFPEYRPKGWRTALKWAQDIESR